MKNKLNKLMMSAVLVTGIAAMSPVLNAAQAISDPVSRLLADAKTRASQISADWKSSAKVANLDWTTDADAPEITRLKEDVDAATKMVDSLTDARSDASPSQIATIDQIIPVMEEIAEDAMGTIEYLNKNQTRLSAKEYKECLDSSYDESNRSATLIGQIVEYGSHESKLEIAKRALESVE